MLERTKVQSPFYTAEHEAFRDVMRRFVTREIEPYAHEWDEAGEFPRELYKKESDAIERQGATSNDGEGDDFPTDPIARSLGDLVTAKQLGMIRAIARELNIDPDEECNTVMHCSTDELTKRAASSLIQHLQDMQRSKDSAAKSPLRRVS